MAYQGDRERVEGSEGVAVGLEAEGRGGPVIGEPEDRVVVLTEAEDNNR